MIQWCVHVQPPRQGISHKKRGNSPCQDMSAVKENDDVIVAVLSDGLGQLEYSKMAAAALTESLSTYLLKEYKQFEKEQFRREWLKNAILAEGKRAIQGYSNSLNISISKMDCTLLFVILFKDASQFICGQLGDGAICVVNSHQGFLTLSLDDKFKATSNLTKTVLSKDALTYFNLKIYPAKDIKGFFLTTDGLENEIYSKAGKVKKKVEWYFNLISNNGFSLCASKISNRWDELTSDEKYGFTDDMSLIAIVQQNTKIELPEDATWRCACGNRNRMESTRCENCGKDFLKVYKGINFKQAHGSKLAYFTYLNAHPEEELHALEKHCEYPLEFLKQKDDKAQQSRLPHVEASLQEQPIKQIVDTKVRTRRNIGRKLNILVCLLGTFMLGVLAHTLLDLAIGNTSKNATKVFNLQKENDSLQLENEFLSKRVDILNTRIAELEDGQSKKVSIPYDYDHYAISNGDVYIGRLSQGLPNGSGVVYSSDVLMAGYFENGMKNGVFYFLFEDGHSKISKYENDQLVFETSLSIDEIVESSTQSNELGVLDTTTETKTYELIYDADVREAPNRESILVISLKKGDAVQSYGNIVTDDEGVKWLKITTIAGDNGWVGVNQVQEIR